MNKIVDVKTGKQYNIFSKRGKEILKSYVKLFYKDSLVGGSVCGVNDKDLLESNP